MSKVLLVDDQWLSIRLYTHMLEGLDHTVVTAMDGLQAIRQLDEEQVDLILTDISMPRMDGWTFLRRLRNDPRYTRLPVVIYTANSQEMHWPELMAELGASAYLFQPFSTLELQETIADCLKTVGVQQ